MRKALALASIAVALAIANDRLTDKDRAAAIDHLQMSRKLFLESVTGLTPAQLHFKPSPEAWSVYECAEHITVSEDLMMETMGQVAASTAKPEVKAKATDEKVLLYGTDRNRRTKAEGAYKPVNRWKSIEEMLAHFEASRAKTIEFAAKMPADMRDHLTEDGSLDGYQFLVILSAHTQRHTLQIQEVKANPSFPKGS